MMLAVQMKVDKDCLSCLVKQEENKSHAGKKPLSFEDKQRPINVLGDMEGFGLRS